MFDFHKDKKLYFQIQYQISKDSIIPFVMAHLKNEQNLKILEIGCAEAGVLKAFTDLGHQCTGIELSESRIETAKSFFEDELKSGQIDFIVKDIYDIDPLRDLKHKYDLVILKDVIEHIHDQKKFIAKLQDFINPCGIIFFAFPPWYMPYGGHQQMAVNKIASILPYYHILPKPLYKLCLKIFGEDEKKISDLLEIKETGISIERFQKVIRNSGFKIITKKFYLINPIYKYKFNIKEVEQFNLISKLYLVRNFFSSSAYYIIGI